MSNKISLASILEGEILRAVGNSIRSVLRRKIEEAKAELDEELSMQVAGIAIELERMIKIETRGTGLVIRIENRAAQPKKEA